MAIAVIGELVVGGREFLEALRSDAGEITGELREFSKDHRSTSNEAVDQRLLAHRHKPNPRREKVYRRRESLMDFLFGFGEREGIYFPTRLDEKLLGGQWCLCCLIGLLFLENNENATHTRSLNLNKEPALHPGILKTYP